MSRPARAPRKATARPAPTTDFWRAMPEPARPAGIEPAADPSALLRSLGTPPLAGHGTVADHYLTAVVRRAAGLATALAAAAGLLVEHDDPFSQL